jgi:hypothetical protein
MSSISGAVAFALTVLAQFSAVIAIQLARSGYGDVDHQDLMTWAAKKLQARFVDK